jgi:hypothetical protein
MKERTVLIIKLISTHLLVLPVLLLFTFVTQIETFLLLSITQTLLLITYFSGYWEFFGLKFRVIYTCLIESLIVTLLSYKISLPFPQQHNQLILILMSLIQLYLVIELIKILIVIFKSGKNTIEINFPLRNGLFLITDGGNSKISRLMNYHFYSGVHKKNGTNNSMIFATDIVNAESSAKSFLPRENKDYLIFGEKVYCPMEGLIVKIENSIDDNKPYSGNYPYNTGNTVVIKNNENYFLVGHLRKGSVNVKEGDLVREGDLIAEAGNSGYSERPHIHMQLISSKTQYYWKGEGVNISFQKKNLYKNRLVHPEKN